MPSRLTSNAARFARQATSAAIANAARSARSAASTGIEAAREAARINSYTDPTALLSAIDAGANATIQIANHSRIYPVRGSVAVPDVALAGLADVTALAYSTHYYAYYDDETLADPAPVVLVTTVPEDAQVGAAPGRHFLGEITTPAALGAPTGGGGGFPPGGGGGPLP